MKAIILAGGYGTRISEETETKPKPMVLLDDKPILWHLMNSLSEQGISEFIIAVGYLGFIVEDFITELKSDWQIKVLDTGLNTLTGGRIKRCIENESDKQFLVTYGDGLGNIDLDKLTNHHFSLGKTATVTCVRPPARFGVLEKLDGIVTNFGEKRQSDVGWINGGYFIIERRITDLIAGDGSSFEVDVMPDLVLNNELAAFEHDGFWQPMDTLREKKVLSELAKMDNPPWILNKK